MMPRKQINSKICQVVFFVFIIFDVLRHFVYLHE